MNNTKGGQNMNDSNGAHVSVGGKLMSKNSELMKKTRIHWVNMRDDPTCGETPVAEDCPLCKEYVGPPNHCTGCPIYELTKTPACVRTPYAKAVHEWRRLQLTHGDLFYKTDSTAWVAASQAMIDFIDLVAKSEAAQ